MVAPGFAYNGRETLRQLDKLPNLRRSTLRGGATEHAGLLSRKALEAIATIETKESTR